MANLEKKVSQLRLRPEKELSETVTLLCDGTYEVQANRSAIVSSSCFYLNRLLAGPFKESTQDRIFIIVHKELSNQCYEQVIRFAESNSFDPCIDDVNIYVQMIQLADLWIFQEFVEFLEVYLVRRLNSDTVCYFHALAEKLRLEKLREHCLRVEEIMETKGTPTLTGYLRCPLDGHQNHPYTSCRRKPNRYRAYSTRQYNELVGRWEDSIVWTSDLPDEDFVDRSYIDWSEDEIDDKARGTKAMNYVSIARPLIRRFKRPL